MTTQLPRPRCVVTLVHGTFARRAAWVTEKSRLVRSLRESELAPVEVRSFQWSGRNSHEARLKAGCELADHLISTSFEHPGVAHHVIAHSHGGNVALYALRDDRARAAVSSLVLLATPLVFARSRDIEPSMRLFSSLIPIALLSPLLSILWLPLFAVLILLDRQAQGEFTASQEQALFIGGMAVVSVILAGVGTRWAYRLWRRLHGYVSRRLHTVLREVQSRIIERLAFPSKLQTPVLSVSVALDEAARWLVRVRDLAAYPHRRWKPRSIWKLLALSAVLMTIGAVVTALDSAFSWWIMPGLVLAGLLYVGAAAGLVLLLLALAAQLALVVWPKLFRGHALGFGERSLFDNWLADISTGEILEGAASWESRLFSAKGRGLRHSGCTMTR